MISGTSDSSSPATTGRPWDGSAASASCPGPVAEGLLLRHAFAVFATRGRDTVGLGVDTENATGAPRLYDRHGMTVHYAVDTWETVVS